MLYLHVGLHKTGTTYFQNEVFPAWKGLHYLRNLSVEAFLKLKPDQISLASREGFSGGVVAHQHEKLAFLERLSCMFPEARILISFRDHGSYLNAIYSQFLRYGGTLRLNDFFDATSNSGYIKHEDLSFKAYIDGIATYWGRQPFVYLLSELKDNKKGLFEDMGKFLGVEPPHLAESVAAKRRNVSLGRAQAELLRKMNKLSKVKFHRDGSTRPYRVLRSFHLDPPALCQRWSAMVKNEPIIDREYVQRINDQFAEDWRYVCSKANSRI